MQNALWKLNGKPSIHYNQWEVQIITLMFFFRGANWQSQVQDCFRDF